MLCMCMLTAIYLPPVMKELMLTIYLGINCYWVPFIFEVKVRFFSKQDVTEKENYILIN